MSGSDSGIDGDEVRLDGQRECPECGFGHCTAQWDDVDEYLDGEPPDRINCRRCGEAYEVGDA